MAKLSRPQAELIELMRRHQVTPTYVVQPGSVVELPPEHDRAWRSAHGGKPVMIDTIMSLEKQGVVRRKVVRPYSGRAKWIWELAE